MASKTYFTVGSAVGRSARTGAFVEYTLPNGETTKVMSRRVFDDALTKADQRLHDLARERRKRDTAA